MDKTDTPGEDFKACREKYFDECSTDEKIERLRVELRALCMYAAGTERLLQKLLSYRHGDIGDLLVPMSEKSGFEIGSRSDPRSLKTKAEIEQRR